MRIVPYKSFGDVQLGESEDAVVKLLGAPSRRVINKAGEVELDYQSLVVRLQPPHGVLEITARPEDVCLGEDRFSRHDLPQQLQKRDPDAREICGFMVSFEYGVAVDTDTVNDGWISVFVKGRWDD